MEVKVQNPNLSADDWDLVGGSAQMDKRCERAAVRLNEKFTETVNAGMDRVTVETAVHDVMVQFKDTGAYDTEPRSVLTGLLNKVYGAE